MKLVPKTRGLSEYSINEIPSKTAQEIVVREHYLHRKAPCSKAFGLIDKDGNIQGVVMYGTPSSAPLRKGHLRRGRSQECY